MMMLRKNATTCLGNLSSTSDEIKQLQCQLHYDYNLGTCMINKDLIIMCNKYKFKYDGFS